VSEEPAGTTPEATASAISEILGKHALATHMATATAETERRKAALADVVITMQREVVPAVKDALGPFRDQMPEDHPLAKFFDALSSPEDAFLAALIDVAAFVGLVFSIVPGLGKVLATPLINAFQGDFPNTPLSPEVMANAVQQSAQLDYDPVKEAALSGIDPDRFSTLVYLTGNAPSPQDAFEMFRRDIFDIDQVKQALREGRIKNSYVDSLSELVYTWPSPDTFVNAAIREQIDFDTAQTWAGKAGLDITTQVGGSVNPDGSPLTFFNLMFDVGGRPPGPAELAHMTLRGIIGKDGSGPGAVTFQQGIAESDLKTKWTDYLWQLYQYVPPIETVKGLYLHGAISETQAVQYLQMNGVDANLAQSILFLAEQEYVAQDKRLAKGEIEDLYVQGSLDASEAKDQLSALGYRGATADWILAVATIRREQRILDRSIERIGQQFATGSIDLVGAGAALARLGVPQDQIVWLQDEWQNVQQLQSKRLSASQVQAAYYYSVMDEATAEAYLMSLGYSQYDAWVLLSIRVHEAQPNPPTKPPLPTPIPNPNVTPPTPPAVISEAPPPLPTLPGSFPPVP
jgi:hypothetical protein